MDAFPHHYRVKAVGAEQGDVAVASEGLPSLQTAPPSQFEGPGDRWSPEALLVAAVADCFILTFRAIARYSKLPWISLSCDVEGLLDRIDRTTQFAGFEVHATLKVSAGTSEERALRLLERAEQTCLVTNSLKAASHLEAKVEIATAEEQLEQSVGPLASV